MNTQYQLVKTPEELRHAVSELSNAQVIGLDTETTDLDPYLARLRLIQLATPDGVFIVDVNRFVDTDLKGGDALAPLRRLLSSPRPIKIAHNAKFDAKFIKHNLGVDTIGLFDTLLASQLVSAGDIEERHGLNAMPRAISTKKLIRANASAIGNSNFRKRSCNMPRVMPRCCFRCAKN